MKLIVMSLASLTLLTSCGGTGPATDGFCAEANAILVSKDDVLTKETARGILAHNRYGARRCGWK